VLSEPDAIELAQQHQLAESGQRGKVKFADFVPAHSTNPLHGDYPEDQWAVFFAMPVERIDPSFFVLLVNCRTLAATDSPVM
jgi:hypothetical protein